MQASDFNNNANTSLISAMVRAESVILSLTARGITVQSIMFHGGKPVIRINRHAYCEYMTSTGKASYLQFCHGRQGDFKQGVFVQDAGLFGLSHYINRGVYGKGYF
ncbi:hypothetical protein M5J15_07365 [Serratia symbiotica]|uniref:hypothetical protein n=1 Tax=Serratia symbiotica TaxID=138074 RepID=UPI0020905344|nr:hypothetical protein [Serratia symbiotica]USS96618.1 hypothetical protein M5J15_07365 [Serratia symbiotica]